QTLDGGVLRNNLDGFRTRRVSPGPAAAAAAWHSEADAGVGIAGESAGTTGSEDGVVSADEPVFDSEIMAGGGVPLAVEVRSESAGFQPPQEYDEYTVKYGDTLSGIAERTLGAQGRYSLIYEANRDRMSNPNQLVPGKVLRIPR
ncbi:MAG: LysM peptidoglycan-binding domain-containing protein, partial [Planctomycetaceae bacterium]